MEKKLSTRDLINLLDPGCLVMDGYDDCIVGVCHRFGQEPVVAYDRKKIIRKLMKDGMSRDEAEEFHEFNQIGSYVGERTPCFIDIWRK